MKKVLLTSVALLSVFGAASVLANGKGSAPMESFDQSNTPFIIDENGKKALTEEVTDGHLGRIDPKTGKVEEVVLSPEGDLTKKPNTPGKDQRGFHTDTNDERLNALKQEQEAAPQADAPKAEAPTMKQTSAEAKKAAEKAAPKAAAKTLPNTGAVK